MKRKTGFLLLLVLTVVAASLVLPELLLEQAQSRAAQQVYQLDASDHLLSDTAPSILDKLIIASGEYTSVYNIQEEVDGDAIYQAAVQELDRLLSAGAIPSVFYPAVAQESVWSVSPGFLVDPLRGQSFEVYTVELVNELYTTLTLDADTFQIIAMEFTGFGAWQPSYCGDSIESWGDYYGLHFSEVRDYSDEEFVRFYEEALVSMDKGLDTAPILLTCCTLSDDQGKEVVFTLTYNCASDTFRWSAQDAGESSLAISEALDSTP